MLSVVKVLFCVFLDYFIFNLNSRGEEELIIPFDYHAYRVFIGYLFLSILILLLFINRIRFYYYAIY